jgi:hypothetical protein
MNTVLTAPFTLPHEEIFSKLSIKPGSHFENSLREFLIKVEQIANPKAMYRVSYIDDIGADTVTIEETTFHSQALSKNLATIGRVFPFIATCGIEVDEFPIEQDDILQQYWLNTIKLMLLEASITHLHETLQNSYRIDNLSAMNPGSGDASVWPIEEQSQLFSLFGGIQTTIQQVGVTLLPSYLMVPDISVSGILFPSETKYYNCQLCQREDCPGRQAHFDPELWKSIQADAQ